uniref:Uncharacterized protein n=1 Tax=Sphaerodactylus townsendi TaxID=933632 RepID=A0ACB8ED27_9SAUR
MLFYRQQTSHFLLMGNLRLGVVEARKTARETEGASAGMLIQVRASSSCYFCQQQQPSNNTWFPWRSRYRSSHILFETAGIQNWGECNERFPPELAKGPPTTFKDLPVQCCSAAEISGGFII